MVDQKIQLWVVTEEEMDRHSKVRKVNRKENLKYERTTKIWKTMRDG